MKQTFFTLLLLCMSFHCFAADQEFTIGLASNFSEATNTSVNPYGDDFRKGVSLALSDAQALLKRDHLKLRLEYFDYGADAVQSVQAAQQAIQSSVLAVVGYNASSEALIAAPFHQKAGLLMISPTASSSKLSQFGRYVKTMSITNDLMAKNMAMQALSFRPKRILVIVATDCAYCQDLSDHFVQFASQESAAKIDTMKVFKDDADVNAIRSFLEQNSIDVVILPNHEFISAHIIAALQDMQKTPIFIGGDGWENANGEIFFKLIHQNIQAYFITDWHQNVPRTPSLDFVKKYAAAFSRVPNDDAVLGYDAMGMLLQTLHKCKDQLSRACVATAANAFTFYPALSGNIAFAQGTLKNKSSEFIKVDFLKKQFVHLKTMN